MIKNYKYILFIGFIILIPIVYKTLNSNDEKNTASYYLRMIDKYLINKDNPLGNMDKPCLWIHLHNDDSVIPETNQRKWLSFYSRSTKDFNQPYQYLTVQSIINKCSNDFNIYLINDDSFKKILPNWNVDFNSIANPIKNNLRLLGICNVLNLYGGMFVPSSFICLKSLKSIYEKGINNGKDMFVGEFYNNTSTQTCNNLMASYELMGCEINNMQMQKFIKHLEILNSRDFSADIQFLGINRVWLRDGVLKGKINMVDANKLGILKNNGDIVNVNELVGSEFIEFPKECIGIYVPWDQLILRNKLQWFVKLSSREVLESNTVIGKYLLTNGCN